MQELQFDNIVVQPIFTSLAQDRNISVSALRLDLVHPVISGNKWFKLRYYIEEAKNLNKTTIVTFGGAWSNHIVATAYACKLNQLKSIGIIRGEEPTTYSDTLTKAKGLGMQFYFVSREDFRNKHLPEIHKKDAYLIPEGGYGIKGAEGFSTALEHCAKTSFTHFICTVGTGTMIAGIIKVADEPQQVIGIPVLKNNYDLLPAIEYLLDQKKRSEKYDLIADYHFGGYAKYTEALFGFMNSFYEESNIPTDFVYTGKLFFAVNDLILKNFFPRHSNILVIHSGGLQGNTSLPPGTLIF